jgi:hypothetical protein
MRVAHRVCLLFVTLASLTPIRGQAEPTPDVAGAARGALPALTKAFERTGRVKERIALALALEQAGETDRALWEGLGVVSALAERGARTETQSTALAAALDLVERIRLSREAAPLELRLPPGCQHPRVTMGDAPMEIVDHGTETIARLPPNAGVTTKVTIDCGREDELDDLARGPDWVPYLLGGSLISAAASLYFTARFFAADAELAAPDPIVDPRELGPAAQRLTRARQSRDDAGEAAVIFATIAGGLGAACAYLWLGDEPKVTPSPAVDGQTLGLVLRGVF